MILAAAAGEGAVQDVFAQPAASPVPDGAQVDKVAGGFQFTEGPYWDAASGMLLFSDIPANTIYQWLPSADSTSVYRRPSGRSNGIVAGREDGALLLAQHGRRRVSRVGPDGRETALATHYDGRRLNSPNDVAVRSGGTVYFTDPPYGVEESARELDVEGVYRLAPGAGENGQHLYVNDTRQQLIRAYDVASDGSVSGGEVFARLEDEGAEGGPDGMTVDQQGRVYSTGPGGLWIFAPGGERLDRIDVPAQSTNVTFGGAQHRTLFVTTPRAVYRVRVNATGAR
ncbi:MAG: gluconolactonase [Bacteroidetes bacterium QH_2_67_10]|nr:MAG: gluconolactonase [Bacteroidetes bacterium QH_2_67_10]